MAYSIVLPPSRDKRGAATSSQQFVSKGIRMKIKLAGLSSLENNIIVTEILDAARRSASTGKTIFFQ